MLLKVSIFRGPWVPLKEFQWKEDPKRDRHGTEGLNIK